MLRNRRNAIKMTLLLLVAACVRDDKKRESARRISLGPVERIPEGRTYLRQQRIFIDKSISEGKVTLSAISAVCTHQNCILKQSENGYLCPCHAGRFNLYGEVIDGPPKDDLPWFAMEEEKGILFLRPDQEVGPSWSLVVDS